MKTVKASNEEQEMCFRNSTKTYKDTDLTITFKNLICRPPHF